MKINVKIPKKINIGEIKTGTPSYTLPIASSNVLGGIKVGKNLTIEADGTLNAQAGGNSGIVEESDPTVPAHVKAITKEQIKRWDDGTGDVDLTDYAKKSELPTKTSQLTNDSNFINSVKTINGQSIEGTGNIVIESGSGGTSNVAVSPTEPLTGEDVWFQKSVNLFNKNTSAQNARINANGVFQTGSNDTTASDFIKVEPSTQYTIQGATKDSITPGWYNFYYDINRQPLEGYAGKKGTYTITTPENAYYMRFSFPTTDLNQFQVEKGSTASEYQPFVEDKIYTKSNNGYEEFKPVSSVEEKQMMTIKLSEECYLNVDTAWKRYGLPLHTILSSMGNGFSLTPEGRIKVKKGVSKISMIASSLALRYDNVGECDIGIIIYRNDSTPFMTASYKYYAKISTFETINLIVPLVDVQENDEIELSMTSALRDRFRLSEGATYLSVKKEA